MKKYILIIALIICGKVYAQQSIAKIATTNTDAYVYSFTLLNVRVGASDTATVIMKLKFGDTVQILERTAIKCPAVLVFKKDSINTDSTYYNENPVKENLLLTGNWVKVKYKNVEGFVNDIYLSALPHFNNLQKLWAEKIGDEYPFVEEAFQHQTFLLLNKLYRIPKKSPQLLPKALFFKKKITKKDELVEKSYHKTYNDGLQFFYEESYYDGGVGGYTIKITKKGMTFSEAIMFCRAFFYNAETPNKLGMYKEENKIIITQYGEGGGCTGEIYKNKLGQWEISFGCGGC
jgi:Bacterial SH3 domain